MHHDSQMVNGKSQHWLIVPSLSVNGVPVAELLMAMFSTVSPKLSTNDRTYWTEFFNSETFLRLCRSPTWLSGRPVLVSSRRIPDVVEAVTKVVVEEVAEVEEAVEEVGLVAEASCSLSRAIVSIDPSYCSIHSPMSWLTISSSSCRWDACRVSPKRMSKDVLFARYCSLAWLGFVLAALRATSQLSYIIGALDARSWNLRWWFYHVRCHSLAGCSLCRVCVRATRTAGESLAHRCNRRHRHSHL